MTTPLTLGMTEAWQRRASEALRLLQAATHAPALFRPAAVEQARRDYAKAMNEVRRWSA